jgi:hypothetical protein
MAPPAGPTGSLDSKSSDMSLPFSGKMLRDRGKIVVAAPPFLRHTRRRVSR